MKTPEDLGYKLMDILGSENVYYQPPESVKLKYPCIIFTMDPTYTAKADNISYIKFNRYHVKHIYKSRKNELKDTLLDSFMMISHDNRMIADSMYNDDFTVYF